MALKALVDLATDWKVVVTAIAAGTSVFFSFEERDRKRLEVNQSAIGYVRGQGTLDRFWSDPANTINEIQASYPQHAFCATLGVLQAESTRAEIAESAGMGRSGRVSGVAILSSREALYEETERIADELSYPLCQLEETARQAAAKSVPWNEHVDPVLANPPDKEEDCEGEGADLPDRCKPECQPLTEDVPDGCAAIRAATSPYWRQLAADECLLALDAYGENFCLAEVARRRHLNIVAQERDQARPSAIPMAASAASDDAPQSEMAIAGEEEPDLAALLAEADPEAGENAFRGCAACHKLEPGENAVGPHLLGVVGRDIASVDGYAYSEALSEKDGVWRADALSAYLADPSGWAPGTKMAYAGLRDLEDRADLITYLNAADGTPEPLLPGSGSSAALPESAIAPPSGETTEASDVAMQAGDGREGTGGVSPPPDEAIALPAGPGEACVGGSPTIFSHVANPEDAEWLDATFDELRQAGWDITRPDPQPGARTDGDVRFYWPEQEDCAKALARDVAFLVGAEPGEALKTISLAGTYKNLPRGRMEVWLPRF